MLWLLQSENVQTAKNLTPNSIAVLTFLEGGGGCAAFPMARSGGELR